jgi:UDP-3-O-[3-hydroxymyristoyl] glucosamine N-acyltransferase
VLGEGASVGAGSRLHPHVVLYPGTRVGQRVILHAGARLGVDGFGYAWMDGGHRKVPQVGRCIVADDVEIGANTCLDRGSLGDTVVEEGVKLDNLIHLAHNVRVGAHSAAAALVGIAGSTTVGKGVFFGGQAGVIGHLHLGDGARIAAAAAVLKSVPAGETWSGVPARENREYLRGQANLSRLGGLKKRLAELEAEVARLREAVEESDTP